MKMCRILAFFLLFACLGAPTFAQTERIRDFSSTLIIDPDGSMLVSETISVWATGDQIRRGIVREFPTIYTDPSGKRIRVGFSLVDVQRDGRPEPYHTESRSNGVAIYVGHKDVYLAPGEYSYTLTYRTTRQLGFFPEHDELYWNVNGNGWRLPFDKVSCLIHLPGNATALETVVYEGPQGSTDSRRFAGGTNAVAVVSSRAYGPGEGMTVAVSWPKGFVAEPGPGEDAAVFMEDHGGEAAAAAGLVLVLVYYLFAWIRVGRDPERGTIIPRFAPPKGFSPAMVRMLSVMKFDNTAFTAAVVSMGVKGALRIEDSGDKALVLAASAPTGLSVGELAAWKELRKNGERVGLKKGNHQILIKARGAIRDKLEKEMATAYFSTNTGWMAPGIVITLISSLGLAWFSPMPPALLFIGVWLTFWTFGCFTLVRQVVQKWREAGIQNKAGAIILAVFAVPFLAGEVMGLGFFVLQTSVAGAFFFGAQMLCNALFYHLLKAPTVVGRRVLDEIEGFTLYLGVAEKDRLNFIHPPEETPELFEKFLPYAIALGVENAWGERFASVLAAAGYAPSWYAGTSFRSTMPGDFAAALGSTMQSTIASASTAPGSSSGMSGGSSGGGGGGGGGGGW